MNNNNFHSIWFEFAMRLNDDMFVNKQGQSRASSYIIYVGFSIPCNIFRHYRYIESLTKFMMSDYDWCTIGKVS